jgi:hypothetical protein
MRGGTRAGKSVLSTQIGAWPNWTRIEMDAYKRQKYGTPWMCNPDVDFPAVGKLAKAALRRDQSVVVEESFVDKAHVAALVRWAGFELDSRNVVYVWLELSLEQALARKPESKFPLERLRAEYARYPNRWIAPNELVVRTADVTEMGAIELIRSRIHRQAVRRRVRFFNSHDHVHDLLNWRDDSLVPQSQATRCTPRSRIASQLLHSRVACNYRSRSRTFQSDRAKAHSPRRKQTP